MGAYNTLFTVSARLRKRMLDPEASELIKMTDRICPVAAPTDLKLPFITVYRAGFDTTQVKGTRGPRAVFYHVQIYSQTWEEGAVMAEEVDKALEGFTDEGVRACTLTDTFENLDPTVPAYLQVMIYKVKTN